MEQIIQKMLSEMSGEQLQAIMLPIIQDKLAKAVERNMDDVYFADWFYENVLTDELATALRDNVINGLTLGKKGG